MKALHSFETLGTTRPKTQSVIPEIERPMEILLQFFHHIRILILPVHVHVFQCASAICSRHLANIAKYL